MCKLRDHLKELYLKTNDLIQSTYKHTSLNSLFFWRNLLIFLVILQHCYFGISTVEPAYSDTRWDMKNVLITKMSDYAIQSVCDYANWDKIHCRVIEVFWITQVSDYQVPH